MDICWSSICYFLLHPHGKFGPQIKLLVFVSYPVKYMRELRRGFTIDFNTGQDISNSEAKDQNNLWQHSCCRKSLSHTGHSRHTTPFKYLEGLPFVCFWNPNLVRVWTWCKHKIEWSSMQTLDPQTHDDTFDEKIRKVVSDIWPFPCHSKVLYIKDVLFNTNLESAKTVCRKFPKLFMMIWWH